MRRERRQVPDLRRRVIRQAPVHRRRRMTAPNLSPAVHRTTIDRGLLSVYVMPHVRHDVRTLMHRDDVAALQTHGPRVAVTASVLFTEATQRLVETVILLIDHHDMVDEPLEDRRAPSPAGHRSPS